MNEDQAHQSLKLLMNKFQNMQLWKYLEKSKRK